MRTALHIDDDILQKASKLTGMGEKTTLGRHGNRGPDRSSRYAAAGRPRRRRAESTIRPATETQTVILLDTTRAY